MKPATQRLLGLKNKPTFAYLFDGICQNGDKICAEYCLGGQVMRVTFREFQAQSRYAAYRLSQLLGSSCQGRYVGLQMDNCPAWPALFWGLLLAGYNPVLLDFRASPETLAHLLTESGAIALISDQKHTLSSLPVQYRQEEILSGDGKLPDDWQPHWANQLALCTSGTTATSKVFVYDETTLVTNFSAGWEVCDATPYLEAEVMRLLAFVPFYHIYGLAMFCWYSLLGHSLVYLKDRAPSTILETCRKHQITHIFGVPLMWNNLAAKILAEVRQSSWLKRAAFATLCQVSLALQRFFPRWGRHFTYRTLFGHIHAKLLGLDLEGTMSGGAYLSPQTIRILTALGIPLVNGFGMTEAGIIAIEPGNVFSRRMRACVGKTFPELEFKIVPREGSTAKDSTTIGEVYLRGPSLHSGRLEKGLLLPPLRDAQGWFTTGDLGKLENGYLYILGRCKDTIVPATGEKVCPDEIEETFRAMPGVEEMSIIGLRNESLGEDVTLIVRLKKEWDTVEFREELATCIGQRSKTLALSKRPTKVIISLSALPMTSSMKTQRSKLKNLIEQKNWPCQILPINNHVANQVAATADTDTANTTASPALPKPGALPVANLSVGQLEKEVVEIFAQILHKPAGAISAQSHFITELGGDSLMAIQLGTELEKKYRIFIPDTLLLQCTNAHEIALALEKLLPGKQLASDNPIQAITSPTPKSPITTFEASREYQMFMQRLSQAGGLNPYFVPHDSVVRDTSYVNGRELLNFASYNYLGMSGHPRTIQAAQEAIQKYGTSASGSRLLTGEKSLYRSLEQKLAHWKHVEDSLVLVSGHATNVTFVGNFCNENDLLLYDALSHNSIEQGSRLSKSDSKAFPHNDFQALDAILSSRRPYYEKVLIVVEGAYSMDGDIAPLPEFVQLKKKYGCFLMVDEAHSTGVLGETGRGVDEYFALQPDDIDIRMGTLSKGLGSCGGYLAGKKSLIEFLHYSLPGFVFSVAIPPASAAAALAAIEILEQDHSMVSRLHTNIQTFLAEAHARNFHTCLAQDTAILPILVGEDQAAFVLSHLLRERGVFVAPAVYPAVAKGQARLRFCVTSEHKAAQIVQAMETLQTIAREQNITMPPYQTKVAMA